MKRLLFLLIVVGAGAVALGFYREWWHIGSQSADGKSNVTLSVDTEKIQQDGKAAQKKVQSLGQQVPDKTAEPAEKKDN